MLMKNDGYASLYTNNLLSKEDFVKYRHVMDPTQPLLYELVLLGLHLFPKYLLKWHAMNRVLLETVTFREFSKNLTANDVQKLRG
jgi:hypothetical protein